MKKTLPLFIFVTVFMSAASFAAIDHFNIIGVTITAAGANVDLTIRAEDSSLNPVTTFNGVAGLSASDGSVIADETGTSLTGNFISGVWTGKIYFTKTADPNTLTCADFSSLAIGAKTMTVIPGAYTKLKIIAPGLIYAPGTATGSTGAPLQQTSQKPFSVTIHACDDWFNEITAASQSQTTTAMPRIKIGTGYPGTGDYNYYISSTPSTAVDFAVSGAGNTLFTVAMWPNKDLPVTVAIQAVDIDSASISGLSTSSQNISFLSQNTYYIWALGPASAVAGKNFDVKVRISHSAPSLTAETIPNFSDSVSISAVDLSGNLLSPALISEADLFGPCTNSEKIFTVKYTKSSANSTSGVTINPIHLPDQGKTMVNAHENSRFSNVIVIFADKPETFTLTPDKTTLKRNENAVLSVKINDQYSNPVSSTAVDFVISSGAGVLKDAANNASAAKSVLTDVYGYAGITVTSDSNTVTAVTASVAGITESRTTQIEFADVIENNKIRNYPNPFNPSQGPTTIEYYLDADAAVTLKLYSFSGASVWKKEIPSGSLSGGRKGYNAYSWDGLTDRNMTIAAGLYTLKVEVSAASGKYTLTRKIAVNK